MCFGLDTPALPSSGRRHTNSQSTMLFFCMLLREIVLFYHHYFYSKPFEKILLVVVSAFVTRRVCSSQPVQLYIVYYGSVVDRAAGPS